MRPPPRAAALAQRAARVRAAALYAESQPEILDPIARFAENEMHSPIIINGVCLITATDVQNYLDEGASHVHELEALDVAAVPRESTVVEGMPFKLLLPKAHVLAVHALKFLGQMLQHKKAGCAKAGVTFERCLPDRARGHPYRCEVDGQKFYDQASLKAAFKNITSEDMWKHTEYISAVCANAVSDVELNEGQKTFRAMTSPAAKQYSEDDPAAVYFIGLTEEMGELSLSELVERHNEILEIGRPICGKKGSDEYKEHKRNKALESNSQNQGPKGQSWKDQGRDNEKQVEAQQLGRQNLHARFKYPGTKMHGGAYAPAAATFMARAIEEHVIEKKGEDEGRKILASIVSQNDLFNQLNGGSRRRKSDSFLDMPCFTQPPEKRAVHAALTEMKKKKCHANDDMA